MPVLNHPVYKSLQCLNSKELAAHKEFLMHHPQRKTHMHAPAATHCSLQFVTKTLQEPDERLTLSWPIECLEGCPSQKNQENLEKHMVSAL